jgi:hypothetical protein
MNLDWQLLETYKNIGPPPIVGTFEPQLGDIGRVWDAEQLAWNLQVWSGKEWHRSVSFFSTSAVRKVTSTDIGL